MKVDLIDSMGSDRTVVDAARVSFNKISEKFSEKDIKLIKYLADHNHWSPFAHCFVSFRIQAPIFVARQLQKHTVGLAWNEVSRRYVDSDPEFYIPDTWRKRAENVKQGSSDELADVDNIKVTNAIEASLKLYLGLLKDGVCPEQARMVIPQSMMTEWIWSGSLYAFARVCKLRLDPHTQKETREIAQQIAGYMSDLFPYSWRSLCTS